ncbi:MAG: class I SAM-dependent methyltransferase [Desulfobacteraceae bacterium]|nr:MAG: class I SAM-dependent methyltransferase [Desulfobacteraceae bacterium]
MNQTRDRQFTVKGHFDALAVNNRWGDLYNPTNPHSHSFLVRRLRCMELLGDLSGKRLLDLGCGTGALVELLVQQDVEYQGIDIAPNMVQVAQTHVEELGLGATFKIQAGSVESLPYPSTYFDAVVGMGLLEYFDHPEMVIREALRVSKPGARLVFTIPQKFCLDDLMIRLTRPFRVIARSVTRKSVDVGRDKYTRAEFQQLFTNLGCRVVGERFYNKLILPYPISRVWPRLGYRAAAWAEEKADLQFFATGYILACEKSTA